MVDLDPIFEEERWGSRQKLFVFLTALAIIFDGVDNQLIGIAVPALMKDWALARGEFTPILASGMIGMMLGGAIAGIIGDRVGRKSALIGSMLVFSLFTAAVAIVDNLWTLAALRFLTGLGLGGALPNAAALASEYVPRRHRPLAVTLTIVCVPLGGTLAALLAGAVLPVLGWRWLFGIGGLLPLTAIAVLMRYLPESPRFLARHPERRPELAMVLKRLGYRVPHVGAFVDPGAKAASHVSLSALLTPDLRRDTLALWGAFFSCLLAVYTAFNWVPSVLTGSGLSLAAASNGLAAFNLGGVAGAICAGLVIARLGSRYTILGMSAGAVAAALGLALAIGVWSDPRADHRAARNYRRIDQRGANDDVCAGGACLSNHGSRHRHRHGGFRRPLGRSPEHLRRGVGARDGRQRRILWPDGCRYDTGAGLPRCRPPAHSADAANPDGSKTLSRREAS